MITKASQVEVELYDRRFFEGQLKDDAPDHIILVDEGGLEAVLMKRYIMVIREVQKGGAGA